MGDDPANRACCAADASAAGVLDLAHLARMTLGDRAVEQEVLRLFAGQATTTAQRLCADSASAAASCAHTLKGSARGIGAWRLALAAERVERAAADGGDLGAALAQMHAALEAARVAVNERLQGPGVPSPEPL
jgi:HPt (histidine-containing phosphotransfer) domain-containing protein